MTMPEDVKEGTVCARCEKPIGEFYDDCGYFYTTLSQVVNNPNIVVEELITNNDSYAAICKSCWEELGCNTCER